MGIIANLAASARQALACVLPRAQHAPFPAQRALPTNSGPAGEGFGAQTVPMPNIQVINDWIIPSTLGWTLDAMQGAILQLENGNLYAAHSLMLAMTREATVGHGLMVRRMSLSALRWEIRFPQCILSRRAMRCCDTGQKRSRRRIWRRPDRTRSCWGSRRPHRFGLKDRTDGRDVLAVPL